MGAVTSSLTTFENFEGLPVYTNINTGGGATDNNDVFLEGSQSGGRRVDNATAKGFMGNITAVDLSATGLHAKVWVFCFHWTLVTALSVRIESGATAHDNHVFPAADIPTLGGWIPLWVDISRTPDSTAASGADEANITDIGAYIDIGNVGGAGSNFIIDEIMYGVQGLTITGIASDLADFRSYEDTNVEGNLVFRDGVDYVFSRLTIGTALTVSFADEGFTMIFPDQVLVATTFMGIACQLDHSGTSIIVSNATLTSGNPTGATNRPDFLVTSSSGSLDFDSVTFNGFRLFLLTDACSLLNCTILNSLGVAAAGADLSGTSILSPIVAADDTCVLWSTNDDPDGLLDNMAFEKGSNDHHAIEFGTSTPLTMTLRGIDFSGFSGTNNVDGSTLYIKRSSGSETVTINLIGVTGTVSYKSDGAIVVLVPDPATLELHVIDQSDGSDISGARAYVTATAVGPFPFEDSVTITRSGGTASVSHTAHGLSNGQKVIIEGANEEEYNGVQTISNVSTNAYDYSVAFEPDTPATGTIISTAVIIDGTTDGSGLISDTRTYSSDQEFEGRVRHSTSAPFFKTSPITGTIDNPNGLNVIVQMVRDQ